MSPDARLYIRHVPSPLGLLRVTTSADALVGVAVEDREGAGELLEASRSAAAGEEPSILTMACAELTEYFEGRRTRFDLPRVPRGTAFQRAVWSALHDIPFGESVSYAGLAHKLARPGAARAVGAANGRNPILIVIPCHRVVGASGALVGYAGGLERKRWLLEHERRIAQLPSASRTQAEMA